MMKPRIAYNVFTGTYACEIPVPTGVAAFNFDWVGWANSPVGEGDTPKEAFLDWYNQMVGECLDE